MARLFTVPYRPLSTRPPRLQLVFSDEFEQEGRSFGVEAKDSRWTAENMWYEGTLDFENYRSEQASGTLDWACPGGAARAGAWGPRLRECTPWCCAVNRFCHQLGQYRLLPFHACHRQPLRPASLQINTTGGAAVIKLEKKESWAYVQRFNGEVW